MDYHHINTEPPFGDGACPARAQVDAEPFPFLYPEFVWVVCFENIVTPLHKDTKARVPGAPNDERSSAEQGQGIRRGQLGRPNSPASAYGGLQVLPRPLETVRRGADQDLRLLKAGSKVLGRGVRQGLSPLRNAVETRLAGRRRRSTAAITALQRDTDVREAQVVSK